jgi:hypothetical protein
MSVFTQKQYLTIDIQKSQANKKPLETYAFRGFVEFELYFLNYDPNDPSALILGINAPHEPLLCSYDWRNVALEDIENSLFMLSIYIVSLNFIDFL